MKPTSETLKLGEAEAELYRFFYHIHRETVCIKASKARIA